LSIPKFTGERLFTTLISDHNTRHRRGYRSSVLLSSNWSLHGWKCGIS